ncbi:MAG: 6,7-dimethyl-8-ribityllumazine synthase [Schleiferiaceae bacterium]|nr:6,7-dimethyl-8-ribityllumazine synthase [Schleiferiaceae bacterium]
MATAHRGTTSTEGIPSARGKRFALVVSEWNPHITGALAEGARSTLGRLGVNATDIQHFSVPGSFELIHGCKVVASSLDFDAVIAIGSVIRGETAHFDFVCHGVTHGIAELNAHGSIPVIFCVLTDDHEQQSLDRCGGKHGNKGDEAAIAAVKMAQF